MDANFLEEEDQIHGPLTFICNSYINDDHGGGETQTFYPETPKKIISTKKIKKNDKKVGTNKFHVNRNVGPDTINLNAKSFLKF